jgi:hypothetical protein
MKKIFFQLYHIFKESKEILRQYGSEILKKKKSKKIRERIPYIEGLN